MGCHFLLHGIFPAQGSNSHLLHWQVGSLPLHHRGIPQIHGQGLLTMAFIQCNLTSTFCEEIPSVTILCLFSWPVKSLKTHSVSSFECCLSSGVQALQGKKTCQPGVSQNLVNELFKISPHPHPHPFWLCLSSPVVEALFYHLQNNF